jgi:hypothetical protein
MEFEKYIASQRWGMGVILTKVEGEETSDT